MPRKGLRPRDRRALPPADYKYNSVLMARFINKINFEGKRSTAEKIVFKAMDIIKEKTKSDPLEVFNTCIENVRPLLEVKARRVGGATYQVPVEVKPIRSTSVAMRWLLAAAQSGGGLWNRRFRVSQTRGRLCSYKEPQAMLVGESSTSVEQKKCPF